MNYSLKKKVGPPILYNEDYIIGQWNEYVKFNEKDLVHRVESHVKQGTVKIPVPTPLLFEDFFIFSGMNSSSWTDFKKRPELAYVISHIEQCIFSQNYKLAVANIHNSGLVARKLSLAEKKTVEQSTDHKIIVNDQSVKENLERLQDKFKNE